MTHTQVSHVLLPFGRCRCKVNVGGLVYLRLRLTLLPKGSNLKKVALLIASAASMLGCHLARAT